MSLGTYRSKADAERAFTAAAADQTRGGWISPDQGRVTLAEYAPRWVEARLTPSGMALRPRVTELYEGQLRLHILPPLGHIRLAQLSTPTVRAWYADLLSSGPGKSTAAKCYRLLRAILNTAVQDGLISANPCTVKGAGVEPASERRVPRVEDVYALAEAIGERYRALVLLAAFSGLRRGELLGLTRSHINLLDRSITVEVQRQQSANGAHLVGPPKTEAGVRTVTLPTAVLPELEIHLVMWAAPGPQGLLFTGVKGGPLRVHVLQQQWDRARRAVGLSHLHIHDLRHVAGTLAASTGAGTKELMHRMGHASPQAALRYQHATRERELVIADGMDRLIEEALAERRAARGGASIDAPGD